ncbi:MAG: hypothetical protein LBC77_02260 [Spirochaetaceae bacterium]|jgi:hypothetical protein|nr:hypothetical protein [Spirochaetaceae bacterium]
MPNNKDWLPHARFDMLNMAKVWYEACDAKKGEWNIPADVVSGFQIFIATADNVLQQLNSPERSHVITTEANRVFGELAVRMRYIKDRFFKTPPLLQEDFTALALHAPDKTRTPRGEPRAQMTAEIKRSGTDMLILSYKYAEGTEHLANPHSDLSKQVRWGLQEAADPLELPEVFDTRRRIDIINFPAGSSGKTAYFVIRLHNGKSGYGPYCPIFHAVVP